MVYNYNIMNSAVLEKIKTQKIGKASVVILSFKVWKEIEDKLEDLEDAVRFKTVYSGSRGDKMISLRDLKKKYRIK